MSEEEWPKALLDLQATVEEAQAKFLKRRDQAVKEHAETISRAFHEFLKANIPEGE